MHTHPKLLPKWRLASTANGQEHDPGACQDRSRGRVMHVYATSTFVQQTAADEISDTCRCSFCRVKVVHWRLVYEVAVRQSVLSSL